MIRDLLRRWMNDYADLDLHDLVVIVYAGDRSDDALKTRDLLARRSIRTLIKDASSLLHPDTLDFVRSSSARRVVLLSMQPGCVAKETIGTFLSTCEHYGKEGALRAPTGSKAPLLSGMALANGWSTEWYGH